RPHCRSHAARLACCWPWLLVVMPSLDRTANRRAPVSRAELPFRIRAEARPTHGLSPIRFLQRSLQIQAAGLRSRPERSMANAPGDARRLFSVLLEARGLWRLAGLGTRKD